VILDHDPPLLRVVKAKGGNERMLPLNPQTELALREWGIPRSGWVFPGQFLVDPIKPRTVTKYVTRHLRSIGVNATAHQCRHWFGSSVYERTRDLRLTQELMGHLHPQSTAGYTRINPSRDGADVVQGLSARPKSDCRRW
jgi:integrase/recombinase XerC